MSTKKDQYYHLHAKVPGACLWIWVAALLCFTAGQLPAATTVIYTNDYEAYTTVATNLTDTTDADPTGLEWNMAGLEIERELYAGELSSVKKASLPALAAVGGMALPALFHFLFNRGTETQNGFGIPMATDIAFALGVLALLGSRVPAALKVFLAALAIIDDLGAITIIALFYTDDLSMTYLFLALGVFALLLVLNRLKVYRLAAYLIPGVFMWYFMLESGVHATVAGVLLAFAIPFGDGGEESVFLWLKRRRRL